MSKTVIALVIESNNVPNIQMESISTSEYRKFIKNIFTIELHMSIVY